MTQEGLIHWEIAGVRTFSAISVTVSQWISFYLDGHHMFIWFLRCNPETASHCILTFVVYDERLFTKGEKRLASIPEGKGVCAPYALYTVYKLIQRKALSIESLYCNYSSLIHNLVKI